MGRYGFDRKESPGISRGGSFAGFGVGCVGGCGSSYLGSPGVSCGGLVGGSRAGGSVGSCRGSRLCIGAFGFWAKKTSTGWISQQIVSAQHGGADADRHTLDSGNQRRGPHEGHPSTTCAQSHRLLAERGDGATSPSGVIPFRNLNRSLPVERTRVVFSAMMDL
jgi:hypothetical protein